MRIIKFMGLKLIVLCLALALTPSLAFALTSQRFVVGDDGADCPDAQFSQIQPALDAASTGDSIHICTGIYQEQLVVTKSVDIDADSGVFLVPSGLKQVATGVGSGTPIAAAIFVSGTDRAFISGLTVDGINNRITGCAPRLEGIFYQNASGAIDKVVVRNFKLGPGLGGCQSGSGIFAESGDGNHHFVQVTNCQIHDFQKNGITANEVGTVLHAYRNTVVGQGPTNGAAQNGIQVGFGAKGSAHNNTIANMVWSGCADASSCQAVATGVLVAESDGVQVSENRIVHTQLGIFIDGSDAALSENQVFDSIVFDGIRIEGNRCSVLRNRVASAGEALIFVQGDGNNASFNHLSDAPIGILKASGSLDSVFNENEFDNVITPIQDPPMASLQNAVSPDR